MTVNVASLVIENLDIWTAAIQRKPGGRRGNGQRLAFYGVDRLRTLILSLAMRGKLVAQDPGDEPAAKLLERVAKARDGTAGKKRDKRAKAVPLAERNVPAGWEVVRLDELANPQAGFAFKSGSFNEQGIGVPLIRIRDVGQPFTGTFFSGEYRQEFVVQPGDYLISMDGEFRVAPWAGAPALLNQRVSRLQFYSDEVEARFVAIELQAELSKLQGVKAYTTVDHLSGKQIAGTTISLPPLAEQKRIIAKVDELMGLCDALEEESGTAIAAHQALVEALLSTLTVSTDAADLARNWGRLEEHFDRLFTTEASVNALRETVLKLAVHGRLVGQDEGDEPAEKLLEKSRSASATRAKRGDFRAPASLGPAPTSENLPRGWAAARLGDLVRVINGRAYSKSELLGEGVPVLRVGNLFTSKEWYYSNLALEEDKYIEAGDLIYAWSASFGPFIWQGERVIYHYHIWKLEPFDERSVSRAFLRLYLQHETAAIKASGHGIAMLHMTKDRMEKLPLELPPLAEQHRIVAKFDELMALCDDLASRIVDASEVQKHFADTVVDRAAA